MNATDVEALLNSHEQEEDGEKYEWSLTDWFYEHGDDPIQVKGLGAVSVVETVNGFEGGGESVQMVFKVVEPSGSTKYYVKEGYYASFNGLDLDGAFYEAIPTTKTITVYKRR